MINFSKLLYFACLVLITVSCDNKTESVMPIVEAKSDSIDLLQDKAAVSTIESVNSENHENDGKEQPNDERLIKIKTILTDVFKVRDLLVAEQIEDEHGVYYNLDILSTKLRGKYASIPINRCFFSESSNHIAFLACEIYLSEAADDYKNHLETKQGVPANYEIEYNTDINQNKEKLIQLIVYDLANQTFLGKPDGFPIEQDFWEVQGYGDAMSNISIQRIIDMTNGPGCALVYKNYLVDSPDHYVAIKSVDEAILTSATFPVGQMGGLTGCDVTVEFLDLTSTDSTVTVFKKTNCSCPGGGDCEYFEIAAGEQQSTEVLLKW